MKKFIYLSSAVIFIGCSKSGGTTDACAGVSSSFTANVLPIINSTCATSTSCHAAGSTNSGGPFTNHMQVSGKSAEIKFQLENNLMPKTGSISTADKNKILCWIKSGSPNN